MRALGALLVAAACGRVGFDARTAPGDTAPGDVARSPDALATITYVKVFVAQGTATTFTTAASAAGDAVLIHVACTSAVASNLTLTAPGWTFTRLAASTTTNMFGTTFGAIAPDTTTALFTLSNAVNCSGLEIVGDEFAGVDPTGGSTTFASVSGNGGTTGTCDRSIATAEADDAVWSACTAGNITAIAQPFVKGATYAGGLISWTGYALTQQPANTTETPSFASTGSWIIEAISIKP